MDIELDSGVVKIELSSGDDSSRVVAALEKAGFHEHRKSGKSIEVDVVGDVSGVASRLLILVGEIEQRDPQDTLNHWQELLSQRQG